MGERLMTRTVRWLLVGLALLVVMLAVADGAGRRMEARGRAMVSDGRWEIARGALSLDGPRIRAGGERIAAGERLADVGRRMGRVRTFDLVFFGVLLVPLVGLIVWILADMLVDILRPNPRPEGEPEPAVRKTRLGWEARSTPRGWIIPAYAFGVTVKAARRRALREARRLEELSAKIERDNESADRGFAQGETKGDS